MTIANVTLFRALTTLLAAVHEPPSTCDLHEPRHIGVE